MRPNTDEIEYVGSYGLPPPDDPMFGGKVIVSSGNTVSSKSNTYETRPKQNAPDNAEFRNALKEYLVGNGFITEDDFKPLEEREWKKIKIVENHIYYFRGELKPNVESCACLLGFYHNK